MKTKSLNKNLHRANKAKKDEFYTQLVDIEKVAEVTTENAIRLFKI